MSQYSPCNLNPRKDRDALFVLLISLFVMGLSFGVFYIYLILRSLNTAKKTSAELIAPNSIYLVFGKQLVDNQPDAEYQSRLKRLYNCQFQSAILMGGQTGQATTSEAQAGYNYLKNKGLSQQSIRLEQSSRNTLENLKNTRQFLNRQPVIIISNRYHLTRCSVLASNLGIAHQLCAAEYHFHYYPVNLLKIIQEAFYLHWFFCGKYWALLTQNQRMLDKIS